MNEIYKPKCLFCGSEDIRLPEIGIALGMGGDNYNFCNSCLFGMTADQFWDVFFNKHGFNYPPVLNQWVQDAIDNGISPDNIIYPASETIKSNKKSNPKSSKKTTERNKMTNSLRYDVMRRDNFYCVLCGATGKDSFLVIDHIKPIAKGGKTIKENLRTVCFECNSGKAAK